MHYLDIIRCREMVFPFIHRTLAHAEPAPAYEQEERGMGELGKVLMFARDDQFYPGFAEKASYMLCSIVGHSTSQMEINVLELRPSSFSSA